MAHKKPISEWSKDEVLAWLARKRKTLPSAEKLQVYIDQQMIDGRTILTYTTQDHSKFPLIPKTHFDNIIKKVQKLEKELQRGSKSRAEKPKPEKPADVDSGVDESYHAAISGKRLVEFDSSSPCSSANTSGTSSFGIHNSGGSIHTHTALIEPSADYGTAEFDGRIEDADGMYMDPEATHKLQFVRSNSDVAEEGPPPSRPILPTPFHSTPQHPSTPPSRPVPVPKPSRPDIQPPPVTQPLPVTQSPPVTQPLLITQPLLVTQPPARVQAYPRPPMTLDRLSLDLPSVAPEPVEVGEPDQTYMNMEEVDIPQPLDQQEWHDDPEDTYMNCVVSEETSSSEEEEEEEEEDEFADKQEMLRRLTIAWNQPQSNYMNNLPQDEQTTRPALFPPADKPRFLQTSRAPPPSPQPAVVGPPPLIKPLSPEKRVSLATPPPNQPRPIFPRQNTAPFIPVKPVPQGNEKGPVIESKPAVSVKKMTSMFTLPHVVKPVYANEHTKGDGKALSIKDRAELLGIGKSIPLGVPLPAKPPTPTHITSPVKPLAATVPLPPKQATPRPPTETRQRYSMPPKDLPPPPIKDLPPPPIKDLPPPLPSLQALPPRQLPNSTGNLQPPPHRIAPRNKSLSCYVDVDIQVPPPASPTRAPLAPPPNMQPKLSPGSHPKMSLGAMTYHEDHEDPEGLYDLEPEDIYDDQLDDERFPGYFPAISTRQQAETLLFNDGRQECFLVRDSDKDPDFPHVISLKTRGVIEHTRIGSRPGGKLAIGKIKPHEMVHESLAALVNFHTSSPLNLSKRLVILRNPAK